MSPVRTSATVGGQRATGPLVLCSVEDIHWMGYCRAHCSMVGDPFRVVVKSAAVRDSLRVSANGRRLVVASIC